MPTCQEGFCRGFDRDSDNPEQNPGLAGSRSEARRNVEQGGVLSGEVCKGFPGRTRQPLRETALWSKNKRRILK